MDRTLDPVQHMVQGRRQLRHLIVSSARWHSLAQVRLANARSRLRDLSNIPQHSPGAVKHNRKSQQDEEQPQQEKAQPQIPQYPQFIALRQAQIDRASVIHANRYHTKRYIAISHMEIERGVRRDLAPLDSQQLCAPIAIPDPKRQRAICSSLQKEYRVIDAIARPRPIRDLPACEFGNLSDDPAIQSILGSV